MSQTATNEQASGTIIDFRGYTDERARYFTGREWVFSRLDQWLATPGSGVFRLTGEPGSGKTALASRLYQAAAGQSLPDAAYTQLTPGFLTASHFCSARTQRWITPHAFTESLSLQLARHSVFAHALVERSGDRHVRIVVRQEIGVAHGAATGIAIDRLDLSGVAPEDAFQRTVREPLDALLAAEHGLRVCLLIDALDEALLHTGPVSIVTLLSQLTDLPDRVRFILTSRPDERLDAALRVAARLHLSDDAFCAENDRDVRRYVATRVRTDPRLDARLAARPDAGVTAPDVDEVARTITTRASGNFQYARFLMDAIADGLRSVDDVDALPPGLNGLYFDSLQRVVRLDPSSWARAYAPLMGVLSVAQESLTLGQLQAVSGQTDAEFWKHRGDLRQFIEVVETPGDETARYRLFHQSLADFVRLPTVDIDGTPLTNTFFLPAAGWHERIARHVLDQYTGYWSDCDDRYALRYVAGHLAEAAREGSRLERHDRIVRLVALVTDREFQTAHLQRLEEMPALQRDVDRALEAAATDRHPDAVALVVEAALELNGVRRRYLPPDALFQLAAAGKLGAAEQRLKLYGPEHQWEQAVLLTLAWLGAAADPASARALRDQVVADGVAYPLDTLVARMDAEFGGDPPPSLPDLPPPPDLFLVAGILDRLGGGNNVTAIEPLAIPHGEGIDQDADAAPAYLAEQDGPLLVAFAAQDPGRHTRYFREYLAIHAANDYRYYRNRSLWALVEPVLRHPDPTWVREMLAELCSAALASTRIDFREGLGLALLALRERAGLPTPGATLAERSAMARLEANSLQSPVEGGGDPWGHHLRRLAVLAEIHGAATGDCAEADLLLDQARSLPYGFAGFRAPACFALAEAASICHPGDIVRSMPVLEEARRAAHNIQDYVLCARATSKANAMSLRWWSGAVPPEPLAETVGRFATAPTDAAFAAVHVVGERYELRVDSAQRLHIPDWARDATTQAALQALYQHGRSATAPGGDDPKLPFALPLTHGREIAIPDPEFSTLLAARLAAAVLTEPVSTRERGEWIQLLAPRAASNPTALDLVLTRLVLAAQPTQPALLDRLLRAVERDRQDGGGTPVGEPRRPPPGVPA